MKDLNKVRKAIQIAAVQNPSTTSDELGTAVTEYVALCDDGSIWTYRGTENEWIPLPQLPQGQLREDWLATVGEELVSSFFVQRTTISMILDEYRVELRLAFNSHETAKDAAKAIYAAMQAKKKGEKNGEI